MTHENVELFTDYPDVVGTEELSEMLGVNKCLIQRLLRENKIPSIRIGRLFKVAKVDVIDYVLQKA